jgi:hypothetical protein
VPEARYDCDGRHDFCLEGTRTELLEEIYDWVKLRNNPTQSRDENKRIFWLTGLAGTGKTTIAKTVAKWCSERNLLGASFFFSRGDSKRGTSKYVFSTITHQLRIFHKPLEPLVAAALKDDPDIFHTDLSTQLEKLIVEPLQHLKDTFPSSTVIIIDALDECNGEETISTILSVLSQFIARLPVKIFITSRPEVRIRHAFSAEADLYLHAETRPFILHEIKRSLVDDDLTQFLRQRLKRVEASYPTLKGGRWYTETDIGVLVVKSEGLFIFAATAVKFIEDKVFADPISQLQNLLRRNIVAKPPESSPYWHLDQL